MQLTHAQTGWPDAAELMALPNNTIKCEIRDIFFFFRFPYLLRDAGKESSAGHPVSQEKRGHLNARECCFYIAVSFCLRPPVHTHSRVPRKAGYNVPRTTQYTC